MEQKRAQATESAARAWMGAVCAHAVLGSQERLVSRSAPDWTSEIRALVKAAACKACVSAGGDTQLATVPCAAPHPPQTQPPFVVIAATARGQPAPVCASGDGLALRATLSVTAGSKRPAHFMARVS